MKPHKVGDRVATPKGPGTIIFVRLNPINETAATSYGVALDCMTDKSGLVFLASLVTLLGK